MAKSFKYKDNMYLDTKGIVHNKKILADMIYPVGSIYISVNNTNPKNIFGGEWTQITDRFLYCTTTSNTTGGSNTTGSTILTLDQIPNHSHYLKMRNDGKWTWNSGSEVGDMLEGGYSWSSNASTYNWLIPTKPTGGNQGHTHTQNLPPYFTVYAWYRIS